MKVNILEAHDRLKYLMKSQADAVSQGCDDCLKRNPLSLKLQDKSPYIYIFAHARTADNQSDKRILWQPRLTKPKAQTNSCLFRAKSHTDILEVCWQIPPRELWPQFKAGNVTECEIAVWSINMFIHNREELEKNYPDDLTDEQVKHILTEIMMEMKSQECHANLMKNLYGDLDEGT